MRPFSILTTAVALASMNDLAAAETHTVSDDLEDRSKLPDICYGVALSDASDFGPYQAGALIGLLEHQQVIEESYQVVTGVSLGALNAYILASHRADEKAKAVEKLR